METLSPRAAAAQASRWVRVSGQSGSSRCQAEDRRPYPSLAAPSGGRAALAAGAGPGPSTFPGPRASAAASPRRAGLGWVRNPDLEGGLPGDKALTRGRGRRPAPLGSLCGHVRLWVFCEFDPGTAICPCLCVRDLGEGARTRDGAPRLLVDVGGRIVLSMRGLCLSGVSGLGVRGYVRAESFQAAALTPLPSVHGPT